jgi:hypothetical protein
MVDISTHPIWAIVGFSGVSKNGILKDLLTVLTVVLIGAGDIVVESDCIHCGISFI